MFQERKGSKLALVGKKSKIQVNDECIGSNIETEKPQERGKCIYTP